jgi:hypothetical protein
MTTVSRPREVLTTPPVPIDYERIAASFLADLQTLQERAEDELGGMFWIGRVARRRLIATARVPNEAIRIAADVLDEQPAFAALGVGDTSDLRDVIPLTAHLTAIANQLEQLARKYRDTIAVHRSRAGTTVLRLYQITKGMNRSADLQQLAPRVEEMKPFVNPRGSGRKSRRTKPAAMRIEGE